MVRPRWETFWGRFIDCWRGSFRGYDVGSRCRFCGSGVWLVDDVSMGGFDKIVLEIRCGCLIFFTPNETRRFSFFQR